MRRLIFLLLLIISVPALAHPGRTDSSGGHHNRSTGEYHFHHGYPEHQHPGGVCPYKEKTVASPEPTAKLSSKKSSVSSSSVRPSIAQKNTAISSLQGGNSMSPDIVAIGSLFAATLLLLFAVIGAMAKAAASSRKRHEAETELYKTQQELDNVQQELVNVQKALNTSETALKKLQLSHSCLTQKTFDLQRELNSKSDAYQKACDSLVVINLKNRDLTARLSEKEQAFIDISKALSNHLAAHDQHLSTVFEAKVYASKAHAGKYHCVIHGNWKDYKLMPLRSAIEKGYSPCSLCFGALEKDYPYTGNYPKFSLNAAPSIEIDADDPETID